MKLRLELEFTSETTFYGVCGCGRWKSQVYLREEEEELFSLWGQHCQERHRPKGLVDRPTET